MQSTRFQNPGALEIHACNFILVTDTEEYEWGVVRDYDLYVMVSGNTVFFGVHNSL